MILEFRNRNVLDVAFQLCFEAIHKHCQDKERENVCSILEATLGTIFNVKPETALIYRHSRQKFDRNKAVEAFKYLEDYGDQFKEKIEGFDLLSEKLPEVDPEDLPPFEMSKKLLKTLLEGKECKIQKI